MFFNEEACFSKRVPKETIQTWLAHGGRIYSGETVASYFFAISHGDEWTSILCGRSVVVIHADWILHCVAHLFRVPVAGYVLDDDCDARPPLQDNFPPVISHRPPQGVSRPWVLRSLPPTPSCLPVNVLKRKRQRDSNYPSRLHSESGDSLPRRPRKRRILYSSPSSGEGLSDIPITEGYDSPATKYHHSNVITTNIFIAKNPTPSASHYLSPLFKAMSSHTSQAPPLHDTPPNHQGHDKAIGLNHAYECAPTYALIVNNTSPIVCLKDSSPVPSIDFTRLQFPSRNRQRFPLLRFEPATTKTESTESPTRLVSSAPIPDHVVAQHVSSATQLPSKSTMPQASTSQDRKDKETRLPLEHQGKQAEPPGSLRCLAQVTDPRSDMVIYHMDQLKRTRERATGRDEVQFAMLWENNAIWKGKRFWHETLKKLYGREL